MFLNPRLQSAEIPAFALWIEIHHLPRRLAWVQDTKVRSRVPLAGYAYAQRFEAVVGVRASSLVTIKQDAWRLDGVLMAGIPLSPGILPNHVLDKGHTR